MRKLPASAHLATAVSPHDHIRGPLDARVSLVEYGDFECSACGAAYPVTAALQEELGDQLGFVFRHFPLSTVHPHAAAAAVAAEAAGRQDRFWEMHETLYENQEALDDEDLRRYAAALQLDLERFDMDRGGEECALHVRRDFLGGVRSGVNGTPTFFIDGFRHDGGHDFPTMLLALQQAIARKQ